MDDLTLTLTHRLAALSQACTILTVQTLANPPADTEEFRSQIQSVESILQSMQNSYTQSDGLGTSTQTEALPTLEPRGKIVCFGDSITAAHDVPGGYAHRLKAKYNGRLDVSIHGFNGYTSTMLRGILRGKLVKEMCGPGLVLLVTIAIGSNDINGPSHSQHVEKDTYRQNLRAVIQDVQALCRDAGFLLLTATDVVPEQYTKFCKKLNREHDRTTETHRAYANVPYEAVEGFSNVYVVNLYAPMHIKLTEERIDQGKNAATLLDSRYFTDGVHPSTEGHGVLLTELDGAIKEYFPLVNQAGWKDPSWRALYGEPLN